MTECEKLTCLMLSYIRALCSESDKFESWPRVNCQTWDFPLLLRNGTQGIRHIIL